MATPEPPSRNLILGPILLGNQFSWALFGILCLQTYLYFRWYPKDKIGLKLLVASLMVLEIAETAITSHATYFFTVTIWGDDSQLFASPWSFCVAIILTGIIASIAQFFFARRLWILSHSIPIIVFIILLGLLQLSCSIVGASQILSLNVQNSSKLSTFDAFSIWLAASAACDIAIAIGMVYFLWRKKTKYSTMHGGLETDYLVTRLIDFSMKTGTITAICAVITLGLFLGLKTTDLQDAPFLVLGKLYSNTVLANLNARASLFSDQFDVQDRSRPGGATNLTENIALRGTAPNGNATTAVSDVSGRDLESRA